MARFTWLLIGLCVTAIASRDPMEDPNLFQGDMVLTDQEIKDYLEGEANSAVPLAAIKSNLWPKVIPYSIDSTLKSNRRAARAIKEAIDDYHKYTCLRFIDQTDQPGHIYFYKGGGCSSPVGYRKRRNRISLAEGCWSKGIVMHEIAHSLGFYHEQSRPDRDQHVIIHWDNISEGHRFNFDKQKSSNIDSMSVPYDYQSVMHYGKSAFGRGKVTIETRDKSMQDVIGRRSGFSQYDILQMNLLYSCPGFTRPPPGVKPTGLPPVTDGPTTKRGCYDTLDGCQRWSDEGLCAQSSYKKFMKESCPRSCGYCGFPTSKPSANCKDEIDYCDMYVKKGYCWRSFIDFMRKNCQKSCTFCTSTQLMDEPMVQDKTKESCMDTIHFCDFYVKKGYCKKLFTDYMKRNCPKSCGLCEDGSKQ